MWISMQRDNLCQACCRNFLRNPVVDHKKMCVVWCVCVCARAMFIYPLIVRQAGNNSGLRLICDVSCVVHAASLSWKVHSGTDIQGCYNEVDQTSKVLRIGVRAWHHLHCLRLRLVRRLQVTEWYRILISVIVYGYQFPAEQHRYWGFSGSVTAVLFSRRIGFSAL